MRRTFDADIWQTNNFNVAAVAFHDRRPLAHQIQSRAPVVKAPICNGLNDYCRNLFAAVSKDILDGGQFACGERNVPGSSTMTPLTLSQLIAARRMRYQHVIADALADCNHRFRDKFRVESADIGRPL